MSRMEWFVVGLEAVAIETAEDSWSVVLTLTPDDDGLDRAMFLCKATLTNSLEIEETITLRVQGRRENKTIDICTCLKHNRSGSALLKQVSFQHFSHTQVHAIYYSHTIQYTFS